MVDAPSEATAQTGWSARPTGPAELTTPALRATPPLRGGEYVIALVCRPELEGFPMWCPPIRLRPCFFACGERLSLSQALRLNQPFKSSQPMLVIARAIVGLAAVGRRFEFISQGCGPFFPREISLFGELYGQGECLSLPGLRKDRSFSITRQPRQIIKSAQGSPPTSGCKPSRADWRSYPTIKRRPQAVKSCQWPMRGRNSHKKCMMSGCRAVAAGYDPPRNNQFRESPPGYNTASPTAAAVRFCVNALLFGLLTKKTLR